LIEYVSVVYLTNWLHVQTLSVVFLAALVESVAKKLIQCLLLLLLMKMQVAEIVVRHDVEDHEIRVLMKEFELVLNVDLMMVYEQNRF